MENDNKNQIIVWIIIVILILGAIGFYVLKPAKNTTENPTGSVLGDYSDITTFEDCMLAGYPVTESLPRQCRTPDGRVLVEGVDVQTTARAKDGCYIGGCSGQICSDKPGAVSTCIYSDSLACYKTGTCEKQPSGECGWRKSPSLVSCLDSAKQQK